MLTGNISYDKSIQFVLPPILTHVLGIAAHVPLMEIVYVCGEGCVCVGGGRGEVG